MGKRKKTLYELACEAMDAAYQAGRSAANSDPAERAGGERDYRKARQTFVAAMDAAQNKEDARG